MGTATIEFRLREKRATIWVRYIETLQDAVALAGEVAAYTNAGITRVGFTVSQDVNSAEGVEDLQNMNAYAVCFFRDENDDVVKFVFPSPKLTMFEVDNSRYIVKTTEGEALAVTLGQRTGRTLTFRHGSLSTR